jgi:hypothetical protein
LAEFGPDYDSLNERVIRGVQNAAAARPCVILLVVCADAGAFLCAYFGGTPRAEEGLVAGSFWRDHEPSMTYAGCDSPALKT